MLFTSIFQLVNHYAMLKHELSVALQYFTGLRVFYYLYQKSLRAVRNLLGRRHRHDDFHAAWGSVNSRERAGSQWLRFTLTSILLVFLWRWWRRRNNAQSKDSAEDKKGVTIKKDESTSAGSLSQYMQPAGMMGMPGAIPGYNMGGMNYGGYGGDMNMMGGYGSMGAMYGGMGYGSMGNMGVYNNGFPMGYRNMGGQGGIYQGQGVANQNVGQNMNGPQTMPRGNAGTTVPPSVTGAPMSAESDPATVVADSVD
jgi:hypothetical protein